MLSRASLNPHGNHFSQNQIDNDDLKKIFLQKLHRRMQILLMSSLGGESKCGVMPPPTFETEEGIAGLKYFC
jgi:hypothetical protein